jgi:Predicted nucleotide-binding protein containing TIR-like domain
MPDMMRVFVASSSEQIEVARSAAAALQSPELEAKVWDEETFDFSDSYIESLENELDRADFAVVIFTADDPANVRSKKVNLPRDNVIFELGLFTGRLGRKRCFFVVDGMSTTEVASDLSGVNYVKFYRDAGSTDSSRPSLDAQMKRLRKQMLDQAVRYRPSADVREEQEALWRFSTRVAGHWWERMRTGEDERSAISYVTITVDEVTNTPHLEGWSYGKEGEHLADWNTVLTGAILGKQAKIHYRWEGEHEDEHEQTYGGGGYVKFDDDGLSTASGFFYDTNFTQISAGAHTRVKHFGLYRCDPSDEEIMKKRWSDEATQLIRSRIASLHGR